MEDERHHFESQIREVYGRIIYSHKTHERMADRFDGQNNTIKNCQIILTALTSVFASVNLFMEYALLPYLTALLALITLVVSGFSKEFDPSTRAQLHRTTAADLWTIRESYLSLLTDIRSPSIALTDLSSRRDDLQNKLAALYRGAPHTDGKGYLEAQERIQKMEDMSFSDEEIDRLLPTSLKRSQE